MPAFNLFSGGNSVEALFWMVVGLAFAASALWRHGSARTRCFIAAIVFIVFGVSDLVEVRTGAWWRPWWLFAWKAACVLVLFLMYVDYRRRRRLGNHTQSAAQAQIASAADKDSE